MARAFNAAVAAVVAAATLFGLAALSGAASGEGPHRSVCANAPCGLVIF